MKSYLDYQTAIACCHINYYAAKNANITSLAKSWQAEADRLQKECENAFKEDKYFVEVN